MERVSLVGPWDRIRWLAIAGLLAASFVGLALLPATAVASTRVTSAALLVAPVAPRPGEIPAGVADITDTAAGRALARAAAARFAHVVGPIAALADLLVMRDSTGITVGPRSAAYVGVWSVGPDDRQVVEAVPTTPARSVGLKRRVVASARTAVFGSWSFVTNQCFTRISDAWSWMDHCYSLYRLANDGDASRDWFALDHFAAMQANVPWVMNAASIGTSPIGSSPQAWADWAPRTDTSGPCHQVTIGILAPIGGIGDTTYQCEAWSVTKSVTAGAFSVKWDGRGVRQSRELALEISVSVPQGGWAQWSLPAWVSGSPF